MKAAEMRKFLLAYPSETKWQEIVRFLPKPHLWGSPFSKWYELWDLLLLVFFPGNTAHWRFGGTTKRSSKPSDLSSADWELLLMGFAKSHSFPSWLPHSWQSWIARRKLLNPSVKALSVMGHVTSVQCFCCIGNLKPSEQKWQPGTKPWRVFRERSTQITASILLYTKIRSCFSSWPKVLLNTKRKKSKANKQKELQNNLLQQNYKETDSQIPISYGVGFLNCVYHLISIKCLLCAKHHSKYFTCINLCNPHNKSQEISWVGSSIFSIL